MIERILGFLAVAVLVGGLATMQAEKAKQAMLVQLLKIDHSESTQ